MIEVKSRVSQKKKDESVLASLKSTRFVSDSVDFTFLPCCDSIRFKSIIYTAAPKKKNYRNGCFCVFEHDSELKFGSIIQFCFCDMDNIVIIKEFRYTKATITDTIRPSRHSKLTKSACSKIAEFCYNVKDANIFIAIPVSSIYSKCVHIPQEECQHDVIVTIPNMYEYH